MHWIYRSIRGNLLNEGRIAILLLAGRSFSTSAMKSEKFELPSRKNGNGKLEFEGTLARTDSAVRVEHPSESDLPSSEPVKGRGAVHHKRTLSSFSLEGKVGVVTGGARGLGLMMSQALIISGADLAIVDLDSKRVSLQYILSAEVYERRKQSAKQANSWQHLRKRIHSK